VVAGMGAGGAAGGAAGAAVSRTETTLVPAALVASCGDAERVVAVGVSAFRSTSPPDQFATTTPVMTATTPTRPNPIAVIFQGSHPPFAMAEFLRLFAP